MGAGGSCKTTLDDAQTVPLEEISKLLELLSSLKSMQQDGQTVIPWSDVDDVCAHLKITADDIRRLPRKRGGVDIEALDVWAVGKSMCGLVYDVTGQAIEGVSVASCGYHATTDATGSFRVPRGGPVVLTKPDHVPVSYPAGMSHLIAVLQRVSSTKEISAAEGGEVVDAATGASLFVLPSSLVYKDGTAFTGHATFTLSVVDVSRDVGTACMPGHFRGTAIDGVETQLASFGAAHISALEAATGAELAVASDKSMTLILPSDAPADLDLLDEAPSLWHFDEASGIWAQEREPILVEGQELPPPGIALEPALSAGGLTNQSARQPRHPQDLAVESAAFWRSAGVSFEWSVDQVKSTGYDCGSGVNGTSCIWFALAELSSSEAAGHVTADILLNEAQAVANAALPFAQGNIRAMLQDVLDAAPVSLDILRVLEIPALATMSVRALEVKHGHVARVHCIEGSQANGAPACNCLLLEAAADASGHATVLRLPMSLHNHKDFIAFGQRLVYPHGVSSAGSPVRCGGKKGKQRGGDLAKMVAEGGVVDDRFSSWGKGKLAALLKDRRKFALTLKRMGWWNVDAPLPRLVQLAGKLLGTSGDPLPGEQVVAKGLRHAGNSYAVTQADGSFGMLVAAGSNIVVEACLRGSWSGREWVSASGSGCAVAWAKLSHAMVTGSNIGECTDLGRVRPSPHASAEALVREGIGTVGKDGSTTEKSDASKATFARLDSNADGFISRADLRCALASAGARISDIDLQFDKMDKDGAGRITFENFVSYIFGTC